MKCAKCDNNEVTSTKPGQTLCRVCYNLKENCAEWVEYQMVESGMAPCEIRAHWEELPASLTTLLEGKTGGLGLTGPTGTGKTYAAAAIARKILERDASSIVGYITTPNPIPRSKWFLWEAWPEAVGRLRSHSGMEQAEGWLKEWCRVPLLVLDDIGSERIKGTYADDWAASFLDRIVDNRYRFERPILWTTNLSATELAKIYGSRLVSRLIGPNPLVTIPGNKDQRLKR